MTARAHIEVLPPYDRLAIHVGDGYPDGSTTILRFGEVVMERLEEPAATDPNAEPLRLKEEHARALYEALAKHFGGAPNVETLRRDYDAERKRVDRMIDHLIQCGAIREVSR